MIMDDQQAKFDRDGLNCPHCGCPESRVLWTRHKSFRRNGKRIGKTLRQRECTHCGTRFRSTEHASGG